MRVLLLAIGIGAAGCPQTPALTIDVDKSTLSADGLTRAHITVHVRDPIDRAVVQLSAVGGALSSSSVPIKDQTATADLYAPTETELGRHASRAIDVVASVVVSKTERLDATLTVTAVPPNSGAPVLFVDANPPAAVAGGSGTVDIAILARRVAAGKQLTITATGTDVVDAHATVGKDGTAHAQVSIASAPVDAVVTVTEPASGVSSSLVVRFVAAGQPLYDLTGAFAQIGPARVKLTSGALSPNPQCAIAPSLVLAEFVQTGLDVDAQYTTCDVTFPPVVSIVGTITDHAPQSFYDAIPVVAQQFSLDKNDLGAAYAPPPSIVVVGANLTDPEHDALPTDETDPRVVDADHDGAPGVTVQNSLGGDQHIVFRNIGTTIGTVTSSNLILGDQAGDLLATTETSVFGIGGAFLPNTIALGSVVELVRIDGKFGSIDADANHDGTITCAELIDVAAQVTDIVAPDTPFDCGADK